MAYKVDEGTGDIVISGFEQGIGTSPYTGLTDIKGVNISSILTEAAVNFSTQSVTPPVLTNVAVTGVDTNAPTFIQFAAGTGPENGMCIQFTDIGSLTGVTVATPYWATNATSTECSLANSFNQSVNVTIGGSAGTAKFSTYNMGIPQHFAGPCLASTGLSNVYYMVDNNGYVWTNDKTTTSGYWEFTGNTTLTNASGNGLVYYQVTDGSTKNGYLFVFRGSNIDYLQTNAASHALSWTYGWNWQGGSSGTILGTNHTAIRAPDNRVYFCDGNNVGKFFQTASGTIFDPANPSTWTYGVFNLLPSNDSAQCLAPLGTNILVGGAQDVVYVWNTTSNLASSYILLPESNVSRMVTVNTNTYLFIGNRGWVYITNGTQVSPFVKVPDHIANTVEPYFQWGGAIAQKNRLYFGVEVLDNSGTLLGNYGGVWCIDLTSNAIYLSNQLSYGNYNGYASALIALPAQGSASDAFNNPAGVGLFVGWYNGSGNGLDKTISTPYTGGQSYVISDAIPIGTLLKPITPSQFEFKTSVPLQTGESISLSIAPYLNSSTTPTFTSVLTTNGDGSSFSGNSEGTALQNLQWLLVKATMTSTGSTPSYCRLKEIRIAGATVPLKSLPLIS